MLPEKSLKYNFINRGGRAVAAPRLSRKKKLFEAVRFFIASPRVAAVLALPFMIVLSFAFRSIYGFAALVAVGALVVWYQKTKREEAEASFNAFMKKNNAQFGGMLTDATARPFMYGIGRNSMRDTAIKILHKGVHVGIYQYRYTVGEGVKKRTHKYTIMHVTSKVEFPHLVLDSRSNDGLMSNIPTVFDDDQRLTLEGDFNKYFDFFAPELYRIEALNVLTPVFMQLLIDQGSPYDIEIRGHDTFLIHKGNALNSTELPKMFRAMDAIIENFKQRSETWHFAINPHQKPVLRQTKGNNALRIGDARISTFGLFIPLIAVIVYVGVTGTPIFYPGLVAVTVGSFVAFYYYEQRRYQKRREASYIKWGSS